MEENDKKLAQLQKERDLVLEENCKLINELLGCRYDVRKLHESVQYMQHTITMLNNDVLRLKSRLEEREELLHEKTQDLSFTESELKRLKSDREKVCKQNEGYQLRFNRKIKEIDYMRDQVNHYESDLYKMEIAMPYTDKIASLQLQLTNLKQSLIHEKHKSHSPLIRTSSAPINRQVAMHQLRQNTIEELSFSTSFGLSKESMDTSSKSSLMRSSLYDEDVSFEELPLSLTEDPNTSLIESPQSTEHNRRYSLATKF